MENLYQYPQLNQANLAKVNGGISIGWAGILIEAFRYSDQIMAGYKAAQKKYN